MATPSREQLFKGEALQHELRQIEEQLGQLSEQRIEIASIRETVSQFETINKNDELLVPLAAGIFVRANATDEKALYVNVGQGVIVPKTRTQVLEMLQDQEKQLNEAEEQLARKYHTTLSQLQELAQQLQDSTGTQAKER